MLSDEEVRRLFAAAAQRPPATVEASWATGAAVKVARLAEELALVHLTSRPEYMMAFKQAITCAELLQAALMVIVQWDGGTNAVDE